MLNSCAATKPHLSSLRECELWCGLSVSDVCTHTCTHGRTQDAGIFLTCVCVCVPFIMLELRSAGSYSTCQDWSPSPSQLLCFGSVEDTASLLNLYRERVRRRERKRKKIQSCMSTIYTGRAIKRFSCRRSQCSRCFTASCLSVGSNNSRFHLWSATEPMCRSYRAAVYLKREKHGIKRLSGINQFISWSKISWRVNCQPLNAWTGAELLPPRPGRRSRDPIRGEGRANAVKHTEIHLEKPLASVNCFFCQLRYELSSQHQRDWCNLLLLIWLKGKVVATHKTQSINFVSQQLCKQMACEYQMDMFPPLAPCWCKSESD